MNVLEVALVVGAVALFVVLNWYVKGCERI